MTNKHGLLDGLKHVVFEDEPESAQKPAAAPHLAAAPPVAYVPQESFAAAPVFASAPAIDTGTVPDSDEVYQRILSKTDFEGTDVAATIHKFLDPLKAISDTVMPPNIKFQTAVLQAKAQAGLTEETILGAFDKLKAQLQHEQEAFGVKAQQFSDHEIAARQDRITQISSQITQLQQELGKLSSELVEAQGKGTRAQSQFAAAVQRRGIEIEQQKAQYSALLKG